MSSKGTGNSKSNKYHCKFFPLNHIKKWRTIRNQFIIPDRTNYCTSFQKVDTYFLLSHTQCFIQYCIVSREFWKEADGSVVKDVERKCRYPSVQQAQLVLIHLCFYCLLIRALVIDAGPALGPGVLYGAGYVLNACILSHHQTFTIVYLLLSRKEKHWTFIQIHSDLLVCYHKLVFQDSKESKYQM